MRVDAPRSGLAAAMVAVLALAGCGSAGSSGGDPPATSAAKKAAAAKPRPTVNGTAAGVSLERDPEEGQSFPLPAGTRGAKQAPLPGDAPAAPRRKAKPAPGSEISPGAPSDAEIKRELKQMEKAVKQFHRGSRHG